MSDNNPHLTYHGHSDNDEGCDILSTEQQQKGKATPDHEIVDTTDINDMYDKPGMAYTERKFARAKKYVEGNEDKAGKRIPKTGVYAAAGVGQARAEYSIFEAEAKGPNASLGVKVGVGSDTGASAGVDGVEAKVLRTENSICKENSVDNRASCSVM